MPHEKNEEARDPTHPVERLRRHWAASRPVVIGAVALLCIATLAGPEDQADFAAGADTVARAAYFDEGLGASFASIDAADEAPQASEPGIEQASPRLGFAALSTPVPAGDPFRRFR